MLSGCYQEPCLKSPAVIARPRELSDSDVQFIIDMAERRAELVRRLRAAHLAHDDARALAREVAGIEDEIPVKTASATPARNSRGKKSPPLHHAAPGNSPASLVAHKRHGVSVPTWSSAFPKTVKIGLSAATEILAKLWMASTSGFSTAKIRKTPAY